MKTNTLVLVGLVGASFAGCEIRCLSRDNPPPKTQPPTSGSKINVRMVDYETPDTGEPGQSPPPSDADTLSKDMHHFRREVNDRLARVDAEMVGIKKRLDAAGEHANSQLKGTQQDIETRAQRIRQQLQEIGPSSQQAFQSAKRGIADEMNSIDANLQKLQERLK